MFDYLILAGILHACFVGVLTISVIRRFLKHFKRDTETNCKVCYFILWGVPIIIMIADPKAPHLTINNAPAFGFCMFVAIYFGLKHIYGWYIFTDRVLTSLENTIKREVTKLLKLPPSPPPSD